MKTIIVMGSGNSGAGAIHDYLLSRKDFQSPFKGKEFRIVLDPDGLDELYQSLYLNFSINGSANKIENFRKFIINTLNSNYNKKNKIYKNNLKEISDNFLSNICQVSYNGSPQFYFDKISLIKKIKFYINRFILKKNSREIELLKMTVPCEENLFLKYSQEFIYKIFENNFNLDKNKNIVIEQGGNFLKPQSSTKYYGEKRKVIFVSRNPKAIFWSMKRRNSLSYPGNNVKIFVEWYKNIIKRIDKKEFENIIHLKFEDFFNNFDIEKQKLSNLLEIDNKEDDFNLSHTLKNLYKYKENLSKFEIDYIDSNLDENIKF